MSLRDGTATLLSKWLWFMTPYFILTDRCLTIPVQFRLSYSVQKLRGKETSIADSHEIVPFLSKESFLCDQHPIITRFNICNHREHRRVEGNGH